MRTVPLHSLLLFFLFPAGSSVADPTAEKNLAQYAKGVFAELAGDRKAARAHYEATLDGDPDSFPVARKTADLQYADNKDLPAASKTLRTFATSHPDHLASQLYYANFLTTKAGKDAIANKSARETLEAADTRFPHTPSVYSRLISLYENRGLRDRSLEVLKAQFEAENAGPDHWMALGPITKTLLPGDSPELTERLDFIAEKTIETGAGIDLAARGVSDYFRKTGRLDEAIAVLEKHIEIVPDSLSLRTRLGLLLIYAKRDDEGLRTLHDTLHIDPDHILAHRSLGQYYGRHGEPAKALHHNAEALRIAGGAAEDFLEVANQYLAADQPHQARLLLERARFDHPDNLAIVARLAIAVLRDGDTSTAARLFRQTESLAKDSDDPGAKDYLDADFQLEFAHSLAIAGDRDAAENRLREAIRSIPSDQPKKAARALRELARLWLDQDKNRGPARSLLQRAESLDPGNAETKELLDRAKGE